MLVTLGFIAATPLAFLAFQTFLSSAWHLYRYQGGISNALNAAIAGGLGSGSGDDSARPLTMPNGKQAIVVPVSH